MIVPDGVLFGSSNAHHDLRKMLVDECELQGVVSMPAGVFKPYAGVSTAVLIFVKGGRTEHVWFYDMDADGYSLDDKRDKVAENDIPDVIARWQDAESEKRHRPHGQGVLRPGGGDPGQQVRPVDQPLQGDRARGSRSTTRQEDPRPHCGSWRTRSATTSMSWRGCWDEGALARTASRVAAVSARSDDTHYEASFVGEGVPYPDDPQDMTEAVAGL